MYDQRADWVGDPAPPLQVLGSIRETYQNEDGTATWTCATAEIGIACIVIDQSKRVAEISLNYGIPDRLADIR